MAKKVKEKKEEKKEVPQYKIKIVSDLIDRIKKSMYYKP